MIQEKEIPSIYIYYALKEATLNGDAYLSEEVLYAVCKAKNASLTHEMFRADLAEQFRLKYLYREGLRIYSTKIWRYEQSAAQNLSRILKGPAFPSTILPRNVTVNGMELCEEQRIAVMLGLSHRLSIILGGAGSGKSTLVQALSNRMGNVANQVFCAPTGKAARNLSNKTGLTARTVHSALGMKPDQDFLAPVVWSSIDLVVVDEASMMTLEMLAGILSRANQNCRVVLIGDNKQLLSVGSGNVIPDLLSLGVPHIYLKENHRQSTEAVGLQENVVHFSDFNGIHELTFDDSFQIHEMMERDAKKALVHEAVQRYLAGEAVQVLAPFNKTVRELNKKIREAVNPLAEGKKTLAYKRQVFRDGDRVMITKNDRDHNCCNGDVGILHIIRADPKDMLYSVQMEDGRCPHWIEESGLKHMVFAYALTIHKSQGSEYDTVLLMLTMSMQMMLYRNLYYTAISRGKKKVIHYGSRQAIDNALQRVLPPRKSMLVEKTHWQMEKCA